jgi:thiazole synthase ThiGH ThiG subunit
MGVEAGREAFEAGLGRKSISASCSSPETGMLTADLDFIKS